MPTSIPTPNLPEPSLAWSRRDLWWGACLACIIVLWHLPAFTLIPSVNHDEIILNAAARSWTSQGVIALPPFTNLGETYATAYYWHPPGHLLVMAGAYQVFGFSIEVTRGVSLAGGALAAFLFFQMLRRFHLPRPMAVVGIALLMAHPLIWWLCRSGRMDLTAICFCLTASLILYDEKSTESTTARASIAGSLIGIAGLFHMMALCWAPALVIAESIRCKRVPWKNGLLIGSLAALPVITWVLLTFARGDGAAWQEQFVGYALQRAASAPLWRRIPDELLLFISQFRYVPGLIPILVVGLFSGWQQFSAARQYAAGGALAAFILIALGTSKGTGAYPIYWFIWFIPVIVIGLGSLRPKIRRGLFILAAANVATVQLGSTAIALYQRPGRDPARVDRFFATHIQPGSRVLGPEDIWYAVEHAGAHLRIWDKPNARLHDYYVTSANIPAVAPPGFKLLAELPDNMPKIFNYYFSHTSGSYRIWVPER